MTSRPGSLSRRSGRRSRGRLTLSWPAPPREILHALDAVGQRGVRLFPAALYAELGSLPVEVAGVPGVGLRSLGNFLDQQDDQGHDEDDDDQSGRDPERGQYPQPAPRDDAGELQGDENEGEQAEEADAAGLAAVVAVVVHGVFLLIWCGRRWAREPGASAEAPRLRFPAPSAALV